MQKYDWDKKFRENLKLACDKTKKIILSKIEKKELVAELSIIANEFYETFEGSPIPVDPPTNELYYDEKFVSATIKLPAVCFMVPYFFYATFLEDNKIDFAEIFSQDIPWLLLIGMINQKLISIRKKLTKTDVLILKALSRYDLSGQKFRFPLTSEILSNRTRQGISIVSTTFPSLYARLLAKDLFLINPWKTGWNIELVVYESSKDIAYSRLDKFTLSKEYFYDGNVCRVIQQPTIRSENEQSLLESIVKKTNGSIYTINKTSFHWDISGLRPREDESFKQVPIFAPDLIQDITPDVEFSNDKNSLDWLTYITDRKAMKKLYYPKKSAFQDFDDEDFLQRKDRILKIINFILQYGITLKSFDVTAKSLDIPLHEFSKLLHFLIKTEIIALGHRFKFIGAGEEYAFIFRNGTEIDYHTIRQSLLKCCFSYFYEGDGILAGRCQVPDLWANAFMGFMMKYRLTRPDLTIQFGQRIYGYSYFNPNIRMPQNFILDDFGIKEVLTQ